MSTVDVLRSEWTKLRSLRSTWYTLLTTVVLGVGLSLVFSGASALAYKQAGPADRALYDPTPDSLRSCIIAQLAIGVLGALVITSEYATTLICPSLAAVPNRIRFLLAKAAVFAVAALVVGQVVGFGAFLAGQQSLASQHVPHATLGQPGVLRAVLGSGLYLAAIGLLGVGLGTMLRATAGAIAALVTITLLVPVLATELPKSAADWFAKWWPTTAGGRIDTVRPDPTLLSPWAGFAVLAVFVGAVLGIALLLFRSRDV